MTNKTKAATEEAAKLPTAEEFFKTWCNETKRSGGVLIGSSVREFLAAYESHIGVLRERVENLSGELILSEDTIKHQADRYLRLLERTKELEAKIASYESAIDGLKKVVDSLAKMKSL